MRRTLFVLGLVGMVCAAPTAQQPVFRSGVQYVAVDVVVTDKNDRAITDLKKEEFSITEGGKPQSIQDFQFVSVPAVTRTVSVAEAMKEAEPDVATNVAPSPNSRLFVILIDDLHLIEQDIVRIKTTLRDLVQGLSPDDEVALTFVSFSNLSVNFTRNRGKILAAVENVKAALGFGLDSLGMNGGTARQVPAFARTSAESLKMVTRSLAGSTHPRRAIFFISGGSVGDPWAPDPSPAMLAVKDDLLETFDLARRADVPIYAIDPRGNVTPAEAVRGGGTTRDSTIRSGLKIQRNNLSELAINTGGRAIVGASDMKRMIQEVVQENSSFYLLGYYPEPLIADGKFHDLKVHVSRPGTIVRARTGYVAPSKERATETTAAVLNKAMSAGVNVSGLPIRVFAAPLAATAKGMTTAVTVEVTYPFPIDGSRRIDDTLELSIMALDPDAKVKFKASRPMKIAGTAPSTGDITFLLDEAIELPAQSLTLRVGVASQVLGKAGTSQIAMDVPKVSDSKLQMSGIAIGFDGPARGAVMNASLIERLIPFQPTTTREFKSSDTLKLFGRLFWKGKDQPVVSVSITGSGAPVTVTVPATAKTVENRQEAVLDTVLPLKNLSPGQYHLVIDARLPNGQTASRVVPIKIQ